MKPDYSKLPKAWAVKNDGSPEFKKVIICLIAIGKYKNWAGSEIGRFYGVDVYGNTNTAMQIKHSSFIGAQILTTKEFIALTESDYSAPKPDYSKLPESWAVKDDGSQLFEEKVFPALNSIGPYKSWSRKGTGRYYGVGKNDLVCYAGTIDPYDKELTITEFLALTESDQQEQWMPVRGERILVSDYNESFWIERIFLTYIDGATAPFVCVEKTTEDSFVSGYGFRATSWATAKPLPKAQPLQLTRAQICEKFGCEDFVITD